MYFPKNSGLIFCQQLAETLGKVILFYVRNINIQLVVSFLFLWRLLLRIKYEK